ncbi:unnamed protein product [Brassica rapa]|uniref:C3H1-type domain-containing protein n=2 Tax=Brassica TaxID=3705 RepID=A0A8D9G1A0_BRACM|nr:unnamed protein product [Brassica napus]CAF2044837.1 unnamed protein product [Brassica napus]CAG7864346.1 unnamed protein product [Brassica rapa]
MMVESSEYPVRPGIKDCQFYLRTGRCGYGENCCYNHPKIKPTVYFDEAIRIREILAEFGFIHTEGDGL